MDVEDAGGLGVTYTLGTIALYRDGALVCKPHWDFSLLGAQPFLGLRWEDIASLYLPSVWA